MEAETINRSMACLRWSHLGSRRIDAFNFLIRWKKTPKSPPTGSLELSLLWFYFLKAKFHRNRQSSCMQTCPAVTCSMQVGCWPFAYHVQSSKQALELSFRSPLESTARRWLVWYSHPICNPFFFAFYCLFLNSRTNKSKEKKNTVSVRHHLLFGLVFCLFASGCSSLFASVELTGRPARATRRTVWTAQTSKSQTQPRDSIGFNDSTHRPEFINLKSRSGKNPVQSNRSPEKPRPIHSISV